MGTILSMNLDDVFSYHAPEGDQPQRYEALRTAAKTFAAVILEQTPACADQSAALRKVREAVMTANAAIALKGLV
jgi:hypothetical protein